ncbi:MAG: hypothetical protein IJW37_03140 [Lachnospiraceae bacterium]|nr:hypothetical protein [Lachnospiraceae bacterium]
MSGEGVVVVKEEKKSKSLIGCLFRLAVFAATVYGAVTAAKKAMARLAVKLEAENEDSEKKRYLNFMNGRTVCPKDETVSAVEVNSMAAGVEVDLTEVELSENTVVTVRSLFSGVVIKVPSMVRVEVEDTDIVSGFMNLVPKYEAENLPVIHMKVQSLFSGVKVEMKAE